MPCAGNPVFRDEHLLPDVLTLFMAGFESDFSDYPWLQVSLIWRVIFSRAGILHAAAAPNLLISTQSLGYPSLGIWGYCRKVTFTLFFGLIHVSLGLAHLQRV